MSDINNAARAMEWAFKTFPDHGGTMPGAEYRESGITASIASRCCSLHVAIALGLESYAAERTAALAQERDAIKDAFIRLNGQYQDLEIQTAALRAALDRRDALLLDIAADNDPQDGCAYSDLARAVLADPDATNRLVDQVHAAARRAFTIEEYAPSDPSLLAAMPIRAHVRQSPASA